MTPIPATISPDELLQVVERMPLDELNRFTTQVLQVKARHVAATLTINEEHLIEEIYQAQLPAEKHGRLLTLGVQLENEELEEAERDELHLLTEQSEKLNGIRLAKVAQLATLWQKPFADVMRQLGLWREYAS